MTYANRAGAILILVALIGGAIYFANRNSEATPMNTERKEVSANGELATLAGGCFWCVESAFEQIKGVERVESGYTGGQTANPTYHQVCGGNTGHAEVIQVAFDPKVISYREILEIFFVVHDPTTLNRQGNDVGTQYRSAIFYHSPQQKEIAEKLIAELEAEKAWDRPIVTQVAPLEKYYRAEDYHQSYFRNNPGNGYCRMVIPPKLAKLRKTYAEKMKAQ